MKYKSIINYISDCRSCYDVPRYDNIFFFPEIDLAMFLH